MNYRYYQSPSSLEGLFGISNGNKFFLINKKGVTFTLKKDKLTENRLIEIEEFEYYFNREKNKFIVSQIQKYINNSDMTYRKKAKRKLLEDIEEFIKVGGE